MILRALIGSQLLAQPQISLSCAVLLQLPAPPPPLPHAALLAPSPPAAPLFSPRSSASPRCRASRAARRSLRGHSTRRRWRPSSRRPAAASRAAPATAWARTSASEPPGGKGGGSDGGSTASGSSTMAEAGRLPKREGGVGGGSAPGPELQQVSALGGGAAGSAPGAGSATARLPALHPRGALFTETNGGEAGVSHPTWKHGAACPALRRMVLSRRGTPPLPTTPSTTRPPPTTHPQDVWH